MRHLTIKFKYADKKWPVYLTELFGEEFDGKYKIESNSTANSQMAQVNFTNFDGNSKVINAVKNNEHVISAYIVNNNEIQKVLVS